MAAALCSCSVQRHAGLSHGSNCIPHGLPPELFWRDCVCEYMLYYNFTIKNIQYKSTNTYICSILCCCCVVLLLLCDFNTMFSKFILKLWTFFLPSKGGNRDTLSFRVFYAGNRWPDLNQHWCRKCVHLFFWYCQFTRHSYSCCTLLHTEVIPRWFK